MNVTVRLRGVEEASDSSREWIGKKPSLGITVKPLARVNVAVARDAGAPIDIPASQDTVACMEFADGFKLWMRADDLHRDFSAPSARGTAKTGENVWEIDPQRSGYAQQRGIGKTVVKALEFFDVDLTAMTAKSLSSLFEQRQLDNQGAGVYRIALGGDFKMTRVRGAIAAVESPILLFLHGTASSTKGSFGKLWDPQDGERQRTLSALSHRYGNNAYAYEHRSLTQSPIDNALELVRKLPQKAELHLVSHSRGGLVGELLCLGERLGGEELLNKKVLHQAFSENRDLSDLLRQGANKEESYADQQKKFEELRQLLDEQQLRISRFVRVACPARGTTLASGRLDRWLSMLDHLLGDSLAGDAIYFLLEVVKKRTDPRTLPGLEAMMPQSALVRLLNHPKLMVKSDLSVIAGDVQAKSIWGKLKSFVSDWFYDSDHDLVVNTGSMYGGVRRPDDRVRFVFDQGPTVNHFGYFANPRTVKALLSGLTRPEESMGDFLPLAAAKHRDELPAWRSAVARSLTQGPRPVAIVLPGTMGSSLAVGDDEVWLKYLDIAFGGLDKLDIGVRDVTAGELLDDFYGDFLEYLTKSHAVVPFPYDWRQSVQKATDRLAALIEEKLAQCELNGQPLRLIAHSMGGLVVRATLARYPRLWERMKALQGSRILSLGTPNAGSHEAVRWLTGFNPTLTKLRLLDIAHGRNGILKIVSRYPGLLELLPFGPVQDGFAEREFWTGLQKQLEENWPIPRKRDLDAVQRTWQALIDAPVDSSRMLYIAGCARATVCDFEVDPEGDTNLLGDPLPVLKFYGTSRGDGTVTWESGRLPGVPTWYIEDAQHDELLSHQPAFPAYEELLQTGQTNRLPQSEPQTARGMALVEERFPMPLEIPDSIPAETDLRGFVFGGGRFTRDIDTKRRLPRVSVAVRHGDLSYASSPVCVGHYEGDTIVSAEGALDKSLNDALSEREGLGLYPGPVGTHQVFIHPQKYVKPGGAIVIGLGQVGSLTPGRLETGLTQALLEYASEVARWPDDRFGASNVQRRAQVSCLLIGTGFDNMSVRDSVEVILRAVHNANERLVNRLDKKVMIDQITLLELYEDIAIQAARDLIQILSSGQLGEYFHWPSSQVETTVGGRQRILFEEAPNWWRRLEIVYNKKQEALRYFAFTDRARVEESLVTSDMRLADEFIKDAVTTTRNDSTIAQTLFEMLVPNRLKEQAPDQRDVVLVVDKVSGRYPWELLQDRWSRDGKPLAVAAGMLRQLKTPQYRERARYSTDARALVVGDPDLREANPNDGNIVFTQLPGARAEAEAVVTLLRNRGYKVRGSIGNTAQDVIMGLHEDGYQILHFAGHGVHEFLLQTTDYSTQTCSNCAQPLPQEPKLVSGMVIGPDRFLTPGDVNQMRYVPELVFINCCHLGQTEQRLQFNELAANLAVQFIQMGVHAVIAAGWAVEDNPAKHFAQSFYNSLFDGLTFGDAVRAAREDVWNRYPGSNTWGAYQCYGDPGYSLKKASGQASHPPPPDYVSPSELISDLQNLTNKIKIRDTDPDEIDALLKRIPRNATQSWLARADVCEAVGLAYGELGLYDEAIEYLSEALQGERAKVSVHAIEQQANFQARAAVELARSDTKDAFRQANELINDAVDALKKLCTFSPTVERYALLGSTFKRRAWINAGQDSREDKLDALKASSEYYEKAHNLSWKEGDGALNPYPLIQWLNSHILETLFAARRVAPINKALREEIDSWCAKIETQAAEQELNAPDFWNTAVHADCLVLRAAAALDFDQLSEDILQGYLKAKRRGGSPRELHSVIEHLDFLRDMFVDLYSGKRRAARSRLEDQVTALEGIIERLRAET